MFDFLVLSIIAEGDAYGYQISQIIKRVSDTKDSALYPILKKLQEKGYDCSFSVVSPEEIVIRLSEIQELEEALGYLTKEDAELITLLFFEEFTVKETAQYFGCCPKTIRNRRKKVLEKLKEQLENT